MGNALVSCRYLAFSTLERRATGQTLTSHQLDDDDDDERHRLSVARSLAVFLFVSAGVGAISKLSPRLRHPKGVDPAGITCATLHPTSQNLSATANTGR